MENKVLSKNYIFILNTFFKYLPSRFFIILNSLIIIPLFAYFLSAKEMGIFQLCLGILNLICTCSSDWISKSVLRFWIKYKSQDKLDSFFSNVTFITVISYIIIFVAFFLLKDFVYQKFLISSHLLAITLFLVIPCGIRQALYQFLRIFNRPFLYTFSIVFYQISLILLFLLFSEKFSNVFSILLSMAISIFILDFYILKQLKFKPSFKFSLDLNIMKESLKYSLPLVVTNLSLWSIFNINKFIFQYNHDFINTANVGICAFFTANALSIFFSTFLFSVFPVVIKRFEKKLFIKKFVSNTMQLYFAIFMPFVGLFCFFSKEITINLLSEKYSSAHILLPFYALAFFGHELLKLINIKYHLKNRTYIEMIFSLLVGGCVILLNMFLLPKYGLWAAGLLTLAPIIILLVLNSIVKFSSIDYLDNYIVLKSGIVSVAIAFMAFLVIKVIFGTHLAQGGSLLLFKMVLFVFIYYLTFYHFRKHILT